MGDTPNNLHKLREPFPPHQISKLPKAMCALEEWKKLDKGKCQECGGWHAKTKTMHLDYVGHAALTDRLLDTDPFWTWEPCAYGPDGLPAFDKTGGLWIRLTVCGHTRLGYGNASSGGMKTDGNREKEVIGDALRNAAMRFGAALDLWHKGQLHDDDDGEAAGAPARQAPKPASKPAAKPNAAIAGAGKATPFEFAEEAVDAVLAATSGLALDVVAHRIAASKDAGTLAGTDLDDVRAVFKERKQALGGAS